MILQALNEIGRINMNTGDFIWANDIKYKLGRFTFALWWVNGDWIACSKTNEEVIWLSIFEKIMRLARIEANAVNNTRVSERGKKTNLMSYCGAVAAKAEMIAGEITIDDCAKKAGLCIRDLKKCMKLLSVDKNVQEGFARYQ